MDKEEAHIVAQTVKNLPAMQETQVQLLGQEEPDKVAFWEYKAQIVTCEAESLN